MRDLLAWANSCSTPMEYQIQTVVETPAVLASANALGLTEAERAEIVGWLAANPESGNVIEGTGGARKVRFSGRGKGKSGGYRAITFFTGPKIPLFLLEIFAKNEKSDLTALERRALKALLAEIATTYRSKRKDTL